MSGLLVFNSAGCEALYQFEKSLKAYFGVFYGVEFGEYVKIGKSSAPYRRMIELQGVASYGGKSLGRVCVSVPHTNYSENETKIHDYFSYARKGTLELFDLTIEQFMEKLPAINLEYKDDSARLERETRENAEQLILFAKGLWGPGRTKLSYEKDYKQVAEALAPLMDDVKNLSDSMRSLELSLKQYDFKVLSRVIETTSQTMRDMDYPSNDVDAVKSAVLMAFGYSMDDYLDFRDLYDI